MKNNASQADSLKGKPTLLARPKLTQVSDADSVSEYAILSKLDSAQSGNRGKNATQKRPGIKIFAILALVAVAAFFGNQYRRGMSSDDPLASIAGAKNAIPLAVAKDGVVIAPAVMANQAAASSLASPGASAAATATRVTQAALPAPPVSPMPAQEAAQIVNEQNLPVAPARASPESTMTAALEQGVKPAPAALQKALESKPAATARPTAKSQTVAAKSPTVMDRAEKAERTGAAKKAAAENKARTMDTAAADKDVNLLAAVIAHEKNNTQGSAPLAKNTANTRSTAKTSNAAVAQASEKPARPPATGNRDVVARGAAEPTDSLLKRCSSLGFLEGQLCRMRICSGQWDTDMACKATLSSNTAVTPALTAGEPQSH